MDECELPEPCPMCGNDRGLTRFSDLNNKLYIRCFRCKHGWHSDTFYNALRRDFVLVQAENERLRKERDGAIDRAERAEHVIAEEAMSPESWFCKCDICKSVAESISEAGFCEKATDRWWEVEE